MILNGVSGMDFILNDVNCEIVSGSKFDIMGSGEIDTYTLCGIWYIKAGGGRFRIVIPPSMRFSGIKIKAKNSTINACGFSAGDTDLRMSQSTCVFEGIDSRMIYAEMGEGSAELNISGFSSASFSCGRGAMSIISALPLGDCMLTTLRGLGTITVNDRIMPHRFVFGEQDKAEIFIKCGLGSVNAVFAG